MRWCSPETLTDHITSHASDCWAFGVILWELFSFGDVPYREFSNSDVISFVSKGGILSFPPEAPTEVKELFTSCVFFDPKKRPSFATLFQKLQTLHSVTLSKPQLKLPDLRNSSGAYYQNVESTPKQG